MVEAVGRLTLAVQPPCGYPLELLHEEARPAAAKMGRAQERHRTAEHRCAPLGTWPRQSAGVVRGGFRLGVDFGTSHTVAALTDPDGQTRPLLFDGSPLLASAVAVGPGSEFLVGADALRVAVGDPAALEPNPKRRIDEHTVWLAGRECPVTDLVAVVLQRVAVEASRVTGSAVSEVVLTHPAQWGRQRIGLLTDAAARAGWSEPGLVAEPVAAAAYFSAVRGRLPEAGRFAVVYDLGAGTFDVSVVRPCDGGFDVVATAGLPDVGGLDLDAVAVRHARQLTGPDDAAWRRLEHPRDPGDRQARQSLWQAARAVKEQLSRHSAADLYLPIVDRVVRLTREEFEQAERPDLERTVALTVRVLADAGVPTSAVDGLFLVGGGSRVPLVATLLHRAVGVTPTVVEAPELVVAEGALPLPWWSSCSGSLSCSPSCVHGSRPPVR